MNATQINTVSKPSATPPRSLFWDGFDAHCQGQPLEDMPTAEQRRGWWHANACAAEVVELEDDMADREWFRKGQW